MTDASDAQERRPDERASAAEPVRYPRDHVVAIVDTPEQVAEVLDALTAGGFLESEISVLAGQAEAERLDASTGRQGLLNRVLRIAERLGIENKEMAIKERYEQALREDGHVVLVLAPTDERKGRAADVLRGARAHYIRYFGRFTIEVLAP